jgi:hypothetical protein
MNDLGHVYHKCHDVEEWDSSPREGLDYQQDYRNETYYSIYTQDEMNELWRYVQREGKFDITHLYHFDDSWSHVAEDLLKFELVDQYHDFPMIARLHCTYFYNSEEIGKLLGLIALNGNTVEEVLENLQDRYEDDDQDDYEDYKEVLTRLKDEQLKEQFRDKLDSQLEPRHSTRAVKI